MKDRDKGQGRFEPKPKTQRNTALDKQGNFSRGFSAPPEQQPHGGESNKPELHPPKREQKKPRTRWTDSEEHKAAFQKAFQDALERRKEKLEPEETELLLRAIFDEPIDGLKAGEIRERCQQDRERRAKLAAQYKLRQERKRQQRESVQVFPPPKK